MARMSNEARAIYIERRIADRERTRERQISRRQKLAWRVGAFA